MGALTLKKIIGLLLVVFCYVLPVLASVNVTVNGTGYTIPERGERGWATNVTTWIQAISANTLQPTGGTFTLGADVNFGANFGLKSAYYSSRTSNPSSSGLLRLANTDTIGFRNGANDGNLLLGISSNKLQFNAVDLSDISTAQTLTNKSINADSNTITNIDNADIKAGADIARNKIANGTASHVVINDGSGTLSSEATLSKVRGGSGQDNSSLTFPASGTLATLAGTESLSNKTIASPEITTLANLQNQGAVRFSEQTGNGSNYIGFTAPDAVTNNVTFKWPNGDGSSGQVLSTNGSAVLSWATSTSATLTTSTQTSSSFSAAVNNLYLIDTTSNNVTANLPTAVGIGGQRIVFKVINATNDFIADGNSTETIDGNANFYLTGLYESVTLVSDGANWVVAAYSGADYITGAVTTATNWTFTAGQYGDFASFTLTPGEWDLSAKLQVVNNGATTYTRPQLGFATSSGNAVTGGVFPINFAVDSRVNNTNGETVEISVSPHRVSVTTSTTYYLKGRVNTSITNVQYLYHYFARRIK